METSYLSLLIIDFTLMLLSCGHPVKAMGLCDFSSKFSNPFSSSRLNTKIATINKTIPPTSSILEKPLCPANMIYSNCTTCQGTCELPGECKTNCSLSHLCICPRSSGYLMKGNECVPYMDCGCFDQEKGVIPEGEQYVTTNCSNKCECRANELVCSALNCSKHSTCDVREGTRYCYCEEGYYGDGERCVNFRDCLDLFNANFTKNGVYMIKPLDWLGTPFKVYCNMTDEGGWTVFQRRMDQSINFYRNWTRYKEGFGSPDHEHWLGNEIIFYLTNQKEYQLRIDFVAPDGYASYAKYDHFRIASESDHYKLISVGIYIKPSGRDNLLHHKGQAFSTYDRDHDNNVNGNCAVIHHSAWWFTNCLFCDLNAPIIHWGHLPGGQYNIIYTEMKLRPV